jgi:hypothetical protein
MLEHNLPPLRFGSMRLLGHFLSHLDASWFTQGLILNHTTDKQWINVGAQVNFGFKHWFNLESTLSGGVAQAWAKNDKSWEWFISLKLLRD